ncbi:MAG: serine/threonine-protein phosphatase [Oscillospiraceae bacterium]|nr:serine/threonine-protein phosphatase [Oscillospiraceae bacterium]
MELDVYSYTDQGGRSYNEDAVENRITPEGSGIFVVADGLGGHARGEEASAMAAEAIVFGWDFSEGDPAAQMQRVFAEANAAILGLQQERGTVIKTTASALVLTDAYAYWANTGDSRIYRLHGNRIVSCTEDHSVAFKKYKAGEITRRQIATDEDQSRLLRSLGSEDRFEPSIYASNEPPEPGDGYFLCSDGAWEYLQDEEIAVDFTKAQTAEQWAELLLLRIMSRVSGEHDNLSVMTVIVK